MKKLTYLSFTFCLILLATTIHAAPYAPKPVEKEAIEKQAAAEKAAWENRSRKEKRAKRKEMKKELKTALKKAKGQDANSDIDLTLLIILAILIPPLAMGIYDGISKRFWISLLLTLLFFVPGLIYTLVVILREN